MLVFKSYKESYKKQLYKQKDGVLQLFRWVWHMARIKAASKKELGWAIDEWLYAGCC